MGRFWRDRAIKAGAFLLSAIPPDGARLIGVRRAEICQVGHSAQHGEMFNRLVGWDRPPPGRWNYG